MVAKVKAALRVAVYWAAHVEPALVTGAVAAVAAAYAGWQSGHLTLGLVGSAIAAVQAVFTRSRVSPKVHP